MRTLPKVIFFGDRHYDAWPCREQAAELRPLCDLVYIEEDYPALLRALAENPRAILAVNSIADTPGNPIPSPEVESHVKRHLEAGNDLWVLHGGSAAFWPWAWWRELMPLRWVRGNDPDRVAPSTHPIVPINLRPTDSALSAEFGLEPADLPPDELYIQLASQRPHETLLFATHEGVRFPQAYSGTTFWGGDLHGFLPGHSPAVLRHPAYRATLSRLAKRWLARAAARA